MLLDLSETPVTAQAPRSTLTASHAAAAASPSPPLAVIKKKLEEPKTPNAFDAEKNIAPAPTSPHAPVKTMSSLQVPAPTNGISKATIAAAVPILPPMPKVNSAAWARNDTVRKRNAREAVARHLSSSLFNTIDKTVDHTMHAAGRELNVKFDVTGRQVSISALEHAFQYTRSILGVTFSPHKFEFNARSGQPTATLSIQCDYLVQGELRKTDFLAVKDYKEMVAPVRKSTSAPSASTSGAKRKTWSMWYNGKMPKAEEEEEGTREPGSKRFKAADATAKAPPTAAASAAALSTKEIETRFQEYVDIIRTRAMSLAGDRTPTAVKSKVISHGRTVDIELSGYEHLTSAQLCPFVADAESLLREYITDTKTTCDLVMDFARGLVSISVGYQ